MTARRDLVAEIVEVRERQKREPYPVIMPWRMVSIAMALRETPDMNQEFLRYVPIGIVACIEGFFRSAIRTLIDAGDPFLSNARTLAQIKDLRIDFELLRAVHGRQISVGDLIGHVVSFNDLAQLNAVMSTVIGRDFLELVTTARKRQPNDSPQEPIIPDPVVIFRDVAETFRLRHIYAHELVSFEPTERGEVDRLLESSVGFLQASAEAVGELLHPNAPLTQADMNIESARRLDSIDAALEDVIADFTAQLEPARQRELAQSQVAWIEFRRKHSEFEAGEYRTGSIYPTIYGGAAYALSKVRLESLRELLTTHKEEQQQL
ncbi:MAG TPA: lysozyme inhibitor LprI family protein [Vicinamibacterales bacterium]|nr:lysozyme inhibitor LprI family protein [Vicinamibacterales bacterium]